MTGPNSILTLPEAGSILRHIATLATPTEGQAIAWDPKDKRLLWSIERKARELVGSRVPDVIEKTGN